MTPTRWTAAAAVILLSAGGAWACLHGPRGAAPADLEIAQNRQRALILWSGGRQELVISVDYEAKGSAAAKLNRLAWVIPVPSAPDAYREADPGVLDAVSKTWHEARPKPPATESEGLRGARSKSMRRSPPKIRLLERVEVGDYRIQPIQTVGADSPAALNAWLSENGFGTVPAENMAYYVERDWTWLAVKATLGTGGARGSLKPLQISFASKEIVYPLKFSTHQGTFGLELFIATERPLEGHGTFQGAIRPVKPVEHGLRVEGYEVELPDAAWKAHEQAKTKAFPGFPGRRVVLTRVSSSRLNHPKDPIADWTSDLAFKPGPRSTTKAAAPAKTTATKSAPAESGGLCALAPADRGGGAWPLALLLVLLGIARRRS